MTIKTLGTNTEIIITNINQISKATLGLNTDLDHRTHQTLQPIIDHHPTMAGHRNDKVTIDNSYRDSNRQNSRDRQSNAPPRSDNRCHDRSRDQDRDRTPTRQGNANHSRDSSDGRNPRVHFTSETPGGYYNEENYNDKYLN